MPTDTELAWIAGIVDGEGCITLHKIKATKGAKNPSYSSKVTVGMTHIPTIERLQQLYPGNLTGYSGKYDSNGNKKNFSQLRWEVSSLKAKDLLERILPYLFTKKREAEILLEFHKLPKATSFKETPVWLLEAREELVKRLHQTRNYDYDVSPYIGDKRVYKSTIYSHCKHCGNKMNAYNRNGTPKEYCSKQCSRFAVSIDTEQEIIQDRIHGKKIKDISAKYNIPIGTLKDLLRRNNITCKHLSLS